MKLSQLFLFSIFVITPLFVTAQTKKCSSVEHQHTLLKDREYANAFQQRVRAYQQLAQTRTANARQSCTNPVTIPVAVHFQGVANADIACLRGLVNQQIASLNADFQAINDDLSQWNIAAERFPNVPLGETCVNFCVATQNHPSGFGLADGDMAITVNQTSGDRDNNWAGYLNIFVRSIDNNILGYSPLGGWGNGDGVIIADFAFGGEGQCGAVSSSPSLDRGRTLTHEVGHFFYLNHIWGDGACPVDDGVNDTPPADNPNYGCPGATAQSCGTFDLHMNYMDYTNDGCMYMFSAGQSTRMENYVQSNLQSFIQKAASACSNVSAPACDDGIQNGNETGIDCGGSCLPCTSEPACDDGIQNGDETGIDCGGSACLACEDENAEENCDNGTSKFYVLIKPDNYGSEITWELTDDQENIIASGGPYQDFVTEVEVTELCLPEGCYNFTIFDAFNDGICCDYGIGQYAIADEAENILISGGEYRSFESKDFQVGTTDCGIEPPEENQCTYPTPTTLEYFNNVTRVRVIWQEVPDANRYQVLYKLQNSNTWYRTSTSRTRKTLRNLRPASVYEIRFRARCPEGWTGFGPYYTFNTLSAKQQVSSDTEHFAKIVPDKEWLALDNIYPNPTNQLLNIQYVLNTDNDIVFEIFDLIGRMIERKKIQPNQGQNLHQLDVSSLENGTYFLKITSENQNIIRKFIKQ